MPRYRATITDEQGHTQRAFFHAADTGAARGKLESKGYRADQVAELVEVPEIAESAQVMPCPACGQAVSRSAATCPVCAHPITPQGDATGGLIPYKNPQALTAYYLGLFSLFPFLGFFLAVPAFVLGIKGLRKRNREPEIKGAVHAWIGIVMGGLFTLIWGAVLILIIVSLVFASVQA